MYAGLKPGGKLNVKFSNLADQDSLESFAKLHGFGNIVAVEGGIQASKIVFGAAPAKIKRKNKAAEPEPKANPWATLKKDDKELINEDQLMKDSEKVEVKKFCGEKDIMQGAKPCANCNCGLKK